MMSGKVKNSGKGRVGDDQSAVLSASVNEIILRECHGLYTDTRNGLVKIAESVGLKLLAPCKKISVMLIGNHSAGKSTFINWYIEEHIQKTGVAIETQGFTFVTSGKKRESLTGNATLHLYPHFRPLQDIQRVVDYLNTEISTSRQKKFSLVTFVDTPGLVDGDMNYPFDVNQAILWLGDLADLIFVFFDPIGQALCKRTLNLVEKLNENNGDKIHFYLSKADEAGHESDRQRVLMQIVQELCKRPGLNKTGFDMPTIYIPTPDKTVRCVNQIEDICKEIEKAINQTVQNTLNSLEKDCKQISTIIENKISDDNLRCSENARSRSKGCVYGLIGLLMPLLALVNFFVSNISQEFLRRTLGTEMTLTLHTYLTPIRSFWTIVPTDYHLTITVALFITWIVLILLTKYAFRTKPTLTRKQKKQFIEMRDYVQNHVKQRKQILYKQYLDESIADTDI